MGGLTIHPSTPSGFLAVDLSHLCGSVLTPISKITIIASALGGAVFLGLLVAIWWFIRARRRRKIVPKPKTTFTTRNGGHGVYGVEYKTKGDLVGHKKKSLPRRQTILLQNLHRGRSLASPLPSPPRRRAELSIAAKDAAEISVRMGGDGFF